MLSSSSCMRPQHRYHTEKQGCLGRIPSGSNGSFNSPHFLMFSTIWGICFSLEAISNGQTQLGFWHSRRTCSAGAGLHSGSVEAGDLLHPSPDLRCAARRLQVRRGVQRRQGSPTRGATEQRQPSALWYGQPGSISHGSRIESRSRRDGWI